MSVDTRSIPKGPQWVGARSTNSSMRASPGLPTSESRKHDRSVDHLLLPGHRAPSSATSGERLIRSLRAVNPNEANSLAIDCTRRYRA